jgi:hypothetical protein
MSLETSYEVLEMLRDDGVQTFRAKERVTGRSLELHLFLPFGRPENKVLFEKLKTLPLETRRKFLDIGVDGSTPYLVTDPLPGARGFKAWAEELISGTQSPASAFNAAFAPPTPSRDDGVQILQAGQWKTGTPIPDSLVSKPPFQPPSAPPPIFGGSDLTAVYQAPIAQAPPPPAAKGEGTAISRPGEFTGLFQAVSPEPVNPPAPAHQVGEFTGLFQSPPVPSVPAAPLASPAPPPFFAPDPTPSPAGGGEFTRMFQAPPEIPAFSPAPPPARPAAPEPGGEFTKFFDSPLTPAPLGSPRPMIDLPPPPQPPQAKRGGEFTNVFGRPPEPPPGGFSFDTPQAPPAPPPQAGVFGAMPTATGAFSASAQPGWSQPQVQPTFATGPSEYTKMMGAPALPTLGQEPPMAPAPAPIAKKTNALLYIALGVTIVLVISLAVYLFTRSSSAPAGSQPAATTPAAR